MQICGAHVFVRGWHAHARTCPRRDKGAYGRLTVAARHTYLMDFRRYAVGRAYTHANPAVQISPRKRSRFLSRRAILSSPSSTSSSSSFPPSSADDRSFRGRGCHRFLVKDFAKVKGAPFSQAPSKRALSLHFSLRVASVVIAR